MYRINKTDPSTEPCGTPKSGVDRRTCNTTTNNILCMAKRARAGMTETTSERHQSSHAWRRISWSTKSNPAKGLERRVLPNPKVAYRRMAVSVEWPVRKPYIGGQTACCWTSCFLCCWRACLERSSCRRHFSTFSVHFPKTFKTASLFALVSWPSLLI